MSRLLTHPHIGDVTVAAILHALSDPVRIGIVSELLKSRGGMNCTQTTLRLNRPMAKSTASRKACFQAEGANNSSASRAIAP